jgi:hypothetical protein
VVVVAPAISRTADCAITPYPTFATLVPTVVPVVSLIVPAFNGPEKVVVPMRDSCRGKCQPHHATVRDAFTIHDLQTKRKGRVSPPLSASTPQRVYLCSAGSTENGTPIGNTEGVTLTSFKAHVASVKVAFHCRFNRRTVEVFETVGGVSFDEECVGVC